MVSRSRIPDGSFGVEAVVGGGEGDRGEIPNWETTVYRRRKKFCFLNAMKLQLVAKYIFKSDWGTNVSLTNSREI